MEHLNSYNEQLKTRHISSKARTYLQEEVEPYLKEINWNDLTLEKDQNAFWMAVNRYNHSHTLAQLLKVMQWIQGKNLYPKQVIKVLLK